MKISMMAGAWCLATLAFAHKEHKPPVEVEDVPVDQIKIVNRYCFDIEMPEFMEHRNHTDPPTLDWSSNGCSHVSDHPMGYNFLPSCYHHDFGYHNFKKQGRFNKSNKKRIDRRFLSDMLEQCDNHEHGSNLVCHTNARFYYLGVRWFVGGIQSTHPALMAMAMMMPELTTMTEAKAKKALLSMDLMEEMYPELEDVQHMEITEVLSKMLGLWNL